MNESETPKPYPKLLIVGAFPPPGSTVVGGQLRACQTLMASSFGQQFDFILIDSTQVSNPQPHLVRRGIRAVRRFGLFLRHMVMARPDAALLFAPVGAGLLEKGVMARVGKVLGIPTILFPLGAGVIDTYRTSPRQRLWIAWVFKSSAVNCCQGQAWQDFFVHELGRSLLDSPIIGNWTATPDLIAIGASRSPSSSNPVPRILFLGWLEREKGIFELLEACAALANRASFHLTIAGSGRADDDARGFVDKHGLENQVTFAGWVHGDDLNILLSESDILVLPSWAEGFPMAVVEAMAAGLAVLTTAVGVIPDTLTHEREALIVPPRAATQLTEALERLISDQPLRHRIQTQGFAFASANFTPELAAARLTHTICRCISDPARN